MATIPSDTFRLASQLDPIAPDGSPGWYCAPRDEPVQHDGPYASRAACAAATRQLQIVDGGRASPLGVHTPGATGSGRRNSPIHPSPYA